MFLSVKEFNFLTVPTCINLNIKTHHDKCFRNVYMCTYIVFCLLKINLFVWTVLTNFFLVFSYLLLLLKYPVGIMLTRHNASPLYYENDVKFKFFAYTWMWKCTKVALFLKWECFDNNIILISYSCVTTKYLISLVSMC